MSGTDAACQVMRHGLMERFKAMEDVARMWLRQARLGINELERESGRERGCQEEIVNKQLLMNFP